MIEKQLTILTPTYNRANFLADLYRSLCEQTCYNFQWLVVDDGSNDETRRLVDEFILENKINIEYVYKKNGGKHTALNYSHSYIRGDYVVIVDSDDFLTMNAVEVILKKWEKYSKMHEIACITFQRGNKMGGKPFDSSIEGEFVSTFSKESNKGMKGDHCETVRADLFKKFLFPEFEKEKFIAEGAMWYIITKGYKVVYCDEIVYLAEYLEDGLTKSGRRLHISNPKGAMWHASVFLNRDFCLKIRIKKALLYICYAKKISITKKETINELEESKLLVKIVWPLGCLLFIVWKYMYEPE